MTPKPEIEPRQHGVKGVYYGGDWLDVEDCERFLISPQQTSCHGCDRPCPRSQSRNAETNNDIVYDVCIIGAGCLGAAIARALSQTTAKVLWLDAADDVSQGATKGNSGIVHAGYDDVVGSRRAQYCWPGNQLFPQLDQELRFGYQRNGSLVLAFNDSEITILQDLLRRGQANGVQRLRLLNRDELRAREPHVHPDAVAALYAPDAGNVIPYEFTIALAENAVDNGVQLRLRRRVTNITTEPASGFRVTVEHWEPNEYLDAVQKAVTKQSALLRPTTLLLVGASVLVLAHYLLSQYTNVLSTTDSRMHATIVASLILLAGTTMNVGKSTNNSTSSSRTFKTPTRRNMTPTKDLVQQAGRAIGKSTNTITVPDMLLGGSGSPTAMPSTVVATEVIACRFIVNCAGGASDQIARMINDNSFRIKPRLGDYLLLNRNQGHLAKHTIFPCPDPVLGKGVLVQTTLWGNLILGPTARDMHQPDARDMSPATIQEYILSKCRQLVPYFDAKETIHAFCGARAKSDRGDWIIEASRVNPNMIHVAGIDSPGLAGAPAIAMDVVKLLQQAGLNTETDPNFNPNRAPIIIPKRGMKGLKMGPVGKYDSDGVDEDQMAQNVICKCEKVTELEVVRAMRRSLPIDSSQGIRKRTRAGMGHCQGDPDNYNCEARVRAIIARENGVPIDHVGGRPWPATSTLSERWISEEEKKKLEMRAKMLPHVDGHDLVTQDTLKQS